MSENIIIGSKLPVFSWLPNYLINDSRVTAEILGVALYLNGKPEGWVPRAYDIKKRFGFGKEKWERISREMRELGMLHHVTTQKGKQLVFQIRCEMVAEESKGGTSCDGVSQRRETRPSGNPTIGSSADIERKRAPNKKDVLQAHDHEIEKEDAEPSTPKVHKPPMNERIAKLNNDEKYMYDKLLSFKGMFPGTAIGLVERYTIGEINNMLEVATREGVKNPGSYVVKCLYRKSAGA